MLNRRMLEIIEYLAESGGYRSLEQVVKLVGVGERTVRYDIETIDEFLEKSGFQKVCKDPKRGLLLEEPQGVREYLGANFHHILGVEFRFEEMLIDIAFGGKINVAHTCKKFQLSRTTVRNDLLSIKGILSEYGLKLSMRAGEGLVLSGKELDKRRLQVKILNDFFAIKEDVSLEMIYTTALIKKHMKGIHLGGVDEFICYTTTEEQIPVSDNALSILRHYVIVMVLRVKDGHCLDEVSGEEVVYGEVAKTMEVALPKLESYYKIILNKEEVIRLRGYFLGSHLSNDEPALFFNRGWVELDIIIEELIRAVSEACGVNLIRDDFLVEGLINHIKPTIHRVKNNTKLKDSVYKEIIEECQGLFYTVKDALVHLERFVGRTFPSEEVALLTAHFQGGIKRNKYSINEATRVLLVCGEGRGVSRLVAEQLMENYNLQLIATVTPNQITESIKSVGADVDLIVTTSSLEVETATPVVHIKTIIKDHDVRKLNIQGRPQRSERVLLSNILDALSRGAIIQDRGVIIQELQSLLGRNLINDVEAKVPTLSILMPEANILLGCRAESWEEAVSMAGEVLVRGGYVGQEYVGEMIGNIHKYGTYVVVLPMLAIPHADKEYVYRSGMSLITLAEPVLFPEGIKVDTILAFASANNREHLRALSSFLDMVKSYNFMDVIRGASSSKKVVTNIKKYEFLMNIK